MKKLPQTIFFGLLLLACSKKSTSQSQKINELYQKWQLTDVERTSSEEDAPKIDYKSKNLFLTFHKDGRIDFNLDVNACSGKFREEVNQRLIIKGTDIICTQACCDSVKLNYHEVKKYEINNKTLKLYTDKEIFHLELAR